MSSPEHPFATLEKFQRRWAKGQSGNPGGRPRYASLSNAARKSLDEVNPDSGLTHAQEVVAALLKEAKRGNVWACRELREWTEGKVPQLLQAEIQSESTSNDATSVKQILMAKLVRYELPPGSEEKETDDEPNTD